MGSLPILLIVITEMIMSFNLDINSFNYCYIISHFNYSYFPQTLMLPVWLWIQFKFLRFCEECVYTLIWPF